MVIYINKNNSISIGVFKKCKEKTNMTKKYDIKKWCKAAGIRAIKTMAQTAVGLIGTSVVIADVSWPMIASASLLAGIVSVLTSVAGLPELEEVIE